MRKPPHVAVPTSGAVLMPTNQEGCGGYVDELDAMPVKDLLKYHLIDRQAKVLFVSDADFTLTLAFATYSSQSHGLASITSTCYAPAGPEGEFQYVGARCVQCCKPAPLASGLHHIWVCMVISLMWLYCGEVFLTCCLLIPDSMALTPWPWPCPQH